MAGSSFGTLFQVTTWGESHGEGIGVVVDGCPAGLELCEDDIQKFLNRRKPGQSKYTTPRKEEDQVHILSGIFEGKTTGTPISMVVYNETQRSKDYSNIAASYRPGHADYGYDMKYGFRDYRGGGRSSGRETIGRVAAGAIASKLLSSMGISVTAFSKAIGGISVDSSRFDLSVCNENPFYMPDSYAASLVEQLATKKMEEHDSIGGIIECHVTGMPAGVGMPVFDKLDACLSKALMSIGSVKGIEIGDGFSVAESFGSLNNDPFYMNGDKVCKKTNHAGGILGGISDGSDLIVRAAIKPTPSIFKEQETITSSFKDTTISIKGRHDPMIVPRAVVVVEAMTAITLLDQLLLNMSSRLDRVISFYKEV